MISIAAMPIASVADVLSVPSGKYLTIQSAMEAANQNGDEIAVGPGIYHENINFQGKSVNLYSTNGTALTFIDGQGVGGNLVSFVTEEDENAILDGFTIRSGTDSAINAIDASPTILNCRVLGNSSDKGAGLRVSGGSPRVTDCLFRENTATDRGGAIYCTNSSPSFLRVEVRLNTCTGTRGGGMSFDGGTVGLDTCVIEDNELNAAGNGNKSGGGIQASSSCNLSVTSTSISYNAIETSWSGIHLNGEKYAQGGGLYVNGTLTVSNSKIAANTVRIDCNVLDHYASKDYYASAYARGGGIFCDASNSILIASSITGNSTWAKGNGDTGGQHGTGSYVEPRAEGGGVYLAHQIQLIDCEMQSNSCLFELVDNGFGEYGGWGGGLYIAEGPDTKHHRM